MYNTYTLSNGLRVIQRPSEGDVIYCGYAIATGTRDEKEGEEGLAHFCEHASFKVTKRRNSSQIIRTLEEVADDEQTVFLEHGMAWCVAVCGDGFYSSLDAVSSLEESQTVIICCQHSPL